MSEDLNVRIAKMMGWERHGGAVRYGVRQVEYLKWIDPDRNEWLDCRAYTTDTAAALEAAEKLARDRDLIFELGTDGRGEWEAYFGEYRANKSPTLWVKHADTPSAAICAAIKAVLDADKKGAVDE